MADPIGSSTGFFSMRGAADTKVQPGGDDGYPAGPMDDEQFAAAVRSALMDAVDYIDGYVSRQRANATAYYRGDFFGNEEEGRSQIVMTEVRDVVLQMLPSLLRVFCSSDEVATFEPRTAQKVDQAEQATDVVNYNFYNENDGFTVLYNAFKDALIRKSGVLKWYWDESTIIEEYTFTELSDGQMQLLVAEPDIEILDQQSRPMPNWQPPIDPQTGQPVPIPTPQLHDVHIRRRKKTNKVKVECIPVEELLVSRVGREVPTCPLVAHRKIVTYSDLAKMGYDPDVISQSMSGLGDTFMWNIEAQTRNPAINAFQLMPNTNDESATKVVYNECYVQIDKDGDGIAELRKVCMVGNTVLHDEVVSETPIVILCPDPEPHMIIGNSVADQTMDLQLLMSNVMRNTLDSLAQSIHPRTWAVEGQTNMDDVLNVETGAVIRMRAPGMAGEFNSTFVGQPAVQVIQFLQDLKTRRTGITPQAAGLDPDALQSTTKTAVDATVQGAQERLEMTARLFAEQLKPMFRGILKLMCRHQDQPRMMRLRGKWVEVDPRVWDADMDVIVHVALGRGTTQDQIAALGVIAGKQEGMLQLGGITNPLAPLDRYRNTLAKITELSGYKNVDQFWAPVDMNAIQQQMAAQPPKPDPNMVVAQAQQQKVQGELEIKQLELQFEQQKLQLQQQQQQIDAQTKMAQIESDAQLKREEMVLKDQQQQRQQRLDAVIRLQGLELQYGTQVSSSQTELELQHAKLLSDVLKERDALREEARQHTVEQAVDLHKHAMTTDQKDRAAELQADAAKAKGNGSSDT